MTSWNERCTATDRDIKVFDLSSPDTVSKIKILLLLHVGGLSDEHLLNCRLNELGF